MAMASEKMVVLAVDDVGDGMQCPDHPFRANPGGVCAFCLQEKLGKLVSSSKSSTPFSPIPHHSPSPSSSSPSPPSLPEPPTTSDSRRPRIPFLHRKTKKKDSATIAFTRSKSVAGTTPLDTPRKRWFWSFLLHPQQNQRGGLGSRDRAQSSKISGIPCGEPSPNPRSASAANTNTDASRQVQSSKISCNESNPHPQSASKDDDSENAGLDAAGVTRTDTAPSEKVGRSRSVGCGSRSFSGDFLERISTGLGDCTLRRVESHREGKTAAPAAGKIVLRRMSVSGPTADDADGRNGRQRVRCAGIFGMAMAAAAPPCPAYWAVAAEEEEGGIAGAVGSSRGTPRTRGRGWGWAFASPMRALRPAARGHVEASQEGVQGGDGKSAVTEPPALVAVRV